ncbi:MAG: acyl-CoA/acyl-ACP dehydrogenase [Rhizobiales bacterium]|nr:acyl-CoA/acyl-ACP dehydrogenase [Hyphomicrobiales bacterium]
MSAQGENDAFVAELAVIARRFLAEQARRRAPYETTASQACLSLTPKAAELGWFLLATPEERGGLGQDFAALGALYRELGRALSPLPLMTAMMAVHALREASSDYANAMLDSIGAGDAVVGAQLPHGGAVHVSSAPDGFVLDGRLSHALLPDGATHLLLQADLAGEPAVLLIVLDGGVAIKRHEIWDRTRELADVVFTGVRASAEAILAKGEQAVRLIADRSAHFDLALACDCVGGAEQILDETVEYTRTRRQFGREIGSFQALKHRCADMKTELEAAKALTARAASAIDSSDRAAVIAAGAKILAAQTYRAIAMDAVQMHGGIGFTWEHDCHLFLKRALLNEALGGSPEDYKDRLFEPMRLAVDAARA